eukprot:383186-Prorocentrum_minimum.AAC.6
MRTSPLTMTTQAPPLLFHLQHPQRCLSLKDVRLQNPSQAGRIFSKLSHTGLSINSDKILLGREALISTCVIYVLSAMVLNSMDEHRACRCAPAAPAPPSPSSRGKFRASLPPYDD